MSIRIRVDDYVLRSDVGGGYVIARMVVHKNGKHAGKERETDPAYFGRLEHACTWLLERVTTSGAAETLSELLTCLQRDSQRIREAVAAVAAVQEAA